jgi:hypothetical protein
VGERDGLSAVLLTRLEDAPLGPTQLFVYRKIVLRHHPNKYVIVSTTA